jgi:nitric-oxide synthase
MLGCSITRNSDDGRLQDLFHSEFESEKIVQETRWEQILAEIEDTGTYEHTFAELEHGMRVAWRNAPKCVNRKFWNEIRLLDKRHVKTNEEMFEAILEHCETVMSNGVTEACVPLSISLVFHCHHFVEFPL